MKQHTSGAGVGGWLPALRGRRVFGVMLALVAVVALAGVAASSALATPPEWLVNGKAIKAEQKIEAKNQTVTFEFHAPVSFEYKCKIPTEGTVYPPGPLFEYGFGPAIKLAKTTAIVCEVVNGSCSTQHTVEWQGSEGELGGEPAKPTISGHTLKMTVACISGSNFIKEECEVTKAAPATNVTGGVLAEFKAGSNLACADASSSSWLSGNLTIQATAGNKLSVS